MYRFDIINTLIKKHGYQRYLEIGVEGGEAFGSVQCAVKHGVDPYSVNATFRIPSDEFFAMINEDVEYDIIFVDGLHTDADWGCGIVRHGGDGQDVIDLPEPYSYADFEAHRQEWLNLVSEEEFLQTLR